jgi:hypothetical protein
MYTRQTLGRLVVAFSNPASFSLSR